MKMFLLTTTQVSGGAISASEIRFYHFFAYSDMYILYINMYNYHVNAITELRENGDILAATRVFVIPTVRAKWASKPTIQPTRLLLLFFLLFFFFIIIIIIIIIILLRFFFVKKISYYILLYYTKYCISQFINCTDARGR